MALVIISLNVCLVEALVSLNVYSSCFIDRACMVPLASSSCNDYKWVYFPALLSDVIN